MSLVIVPTQDRPFPPWTFYNYSERINDIQDAGGNWKFARLARSGEYDEAHRVVQDELHLSKRFLDGQLLEERQKRDSEEVRKKIKRLEEELATVENYLDGISEAHGKFIKYYIESGLQAAETELAELKHLRNEFLPDPSGHRLTFKRLEDEMKATVGKSFGLSNDDRMKRAAIVRKPVKPKFDNQQPKSEGQSILKPILCKKPSNFMPPIIPLTEKQPNFFDLNYKYPGNAIDYAAGSEGREYHDQRKRFRKAYGHASKAYAVGGAQNHPSAYAELDALIEQNEEEIEEILDDEYWELRWDVFELLWKAYDFCGNFVHAVRYEENDPYPGSPPSGFSQPNFLEKPSDPDEARLMKSGRDMMGHGDGVGPDLGNGVGFGGTVTQSLLAVVDGNTTPSLCTGSVFLLCMTLFVIWCYRYRMKTWQQKSTMQKQKQNEKGGTGLGIVATRAETMGCDEKVELQHCCQQHANDGLLRGLEEV